jgi:hypothetical protein
MTYDKDKLRQLASVLGELDSTRINDEVTRGVKDMLLKRVGD